MKYLLLIFILSTFLAPSFALSQGRYDYQPTSRPPQNQQSSEAEQPKGNIIVCEKGFPNCTWTDLIKTINNFIQFAFVIAVSLATVTFAWAGWLYLSAGDDTGATAAAREMMWKVVKGFIFMAVAWLLVKALLSIAGSEFSGLQ